MPHIPSTLERFLDDIRRKLAEFDAKLSFDDVMSWVLQFDERDQSLATKLFLKLKYFNLTEVDRLCKALYAHLPEHVSADLDQAQFVGLGAAADSGGMLLYHYRVINNLPESNFITVDGLRDHLAATYDRPSRPRHLVFLDDFIGTGEQAIELLSRELKELLVMREFDYVGLHALVGFAESATRIKTATSVDVRVSHTLTDKDKVFHEASDILTEDYFDRQRMKDTIEQYGKQLYPIAPLGYGGTQALIAFYYNTPNNTLPVIWARSGSWRPLLPRAETKNADDASELEKLTITYLHAVGGQCRIGDLRHLGNGLECPTDHSIERLAARHVVRIIDDDVVQHINLSAKGTREVLALFVREKEASRTRLKECGRHFKKNLPDNPRASLEDYARLRDAKEELMSVLSVACMLGDVETVVSLRRTISWLLLKEHSYEERIRLGTLILHSFSREALGVEWGLITIDDLGWSHVACARLDVATQHIEAGVKYLWDHGHIFGVCQGWRHLQAIKVRKGYIAEAELGLRFVFGASCAIPDIHERLEMQAGIARGLANVCARRERTEAWQFYQELAEFLSRESGDELHATPESRPAYLHKGTAASARSNQIGEAALFVVRHPLTTKNQKQTFGRHPGVLPDAGKQQINDVASSLVSNLGPVPRDDVRVYSSQAKSARLLAERVAEQILRSVETDASLDSIDSGDLTGLTELDAEELFPEIMLKLHAYRQNRMDGYVLEFPGGESVRNLTMRVARFLLETVYATDVPPVVVIVGHNSSVTAILNIVSALDRKPVDSSYRYHDVPVASVTKILCDLGVGKVRIERVGT
jgi:broad specificity phosphatase PhoE